MEIHRLTPELVAVCREQLSQIGYDKPDGYFERCYEQQQSGQIVMFVVHKVNQYVGHVKVVWKPDYPHFRDTGIPEIQDLNVLPAFRRQGVGTALIRACEERAAESAPMIGIGVGLHPGYNNAQHLYGKLGYRLDGHGVHYENVPVIERESYRFDDELVIYFTKALKTD